MWRQRLDILLSQLLPSFGNRTLDYVRRDLFYVLLLGVTSGNTKRRDRHASVAAGGIRDEFEFRFFDGIRDECVLRPSLQDVDELVNGVSAEADTLAPVQTALQTVINPGEELLLTVHDENQRILWQSIEVVENALVFELVDLVEDHDTWRLLMLAQPLKKDIAGRGLAMDVDGPLDLVEDPVECLEAGVVLPAVDVDALDVEILLTEFVHCELRDAGLSGTSGTSNQGSISGFATCERFEDAREVVDLGVAVNHLTRDELGPEKPSVLDHIWMLVRQL